MSHFTNDTLHATTPIQSDFRKAIPDRAPDEPQITAAMHDEAARCVEVLTFAFAADAAARWMYPDPVEYHRWFPQFVHAFGGAAFERHTAVMLGGCAAALWLPPGSHPDEEALLRLIDESVRGLHRDAVFSVFHQMDLCHPKEPHWHLPLIGVDPYQQRKGYGSRLLQCTLRHCDQEKNLAYLEATDPENVKLYQRHGFEVIETIRAKNSPPIFPMVRRPR